MTAEPTVLAEGLTFPECPRWRDGSLWVSDMWAQRVLRLDADGTPHEMVRLPDGDDPGGLGWLPGGDLLVVGMEGRKLWRFSGGGPGTEATEYADLTELAPYGLNDLWVGPDGSAWVTHFGSDWTAGQIEPSPLILVRPDGTVVRAAEDLMIANGVIVDGDHLVVAEPGAARLSRFRITAGSDGAELSEREEIALTPAEGAPFVAPDGICSDPRGGWWVADPMVSRVFRVVDGRTVEEVPTPGVHPTAVMVGDGTLFITAAEEVSKAHRQLGDTGRVLALPLG